MFGPSICCPFPKPHKCGSPAYDGPRLAPADAEKGIDAHRSACLAAATAAKLRPMLPTPQLLLLRLASDAVPSDAAAVAAAAAVVGGWSQRGELEPEAKCRGLYMSPVPA